MQWISAERTAGNGGNGFSLSDNASGSTAVRQRGEDLGGDRRSVRGLGHQFRPPHRTAAAPAKSPACANAAIMIDVTGLESDRRSSPGPG